MYYIFIPETAKDVFVMPRVADKPPLEEGNVKDGRIEIDELEDEHFERQVVVKLRLSSVHFCKETSNNYVIQSLM